MLSRTSTNINIHMLIKNLQQIGLTENQAKIYLACLELGETNIKDISLKSNIKRTSIYDLIPDMINAGILKQTIQGKKRKFLAIGPEELKTLLKKRDMLLEQIMPDLRSLDNVTGTRPKVLFFNGIEGLKNAYEDLLNYKNTTVRGWASEDLVEMLGDEWIDSYIKRRLQKGIKEYMIYPIGKTSKKYFAKDNEHKRTSKLIDPKKYKFDIEINIYHNKVAMVSAKDKVAVIIESKPIVNTLKTIFQICWDSLD